jgi:hypothetical protein
LKRRPGRPRKDPLLLAAEKAAKKASPRTLHYEESRNKLRGAASRFRGLSAALRAHQELVESLRYIRRTTTGYQVTIYRGIAKFDKTFKEFSPESLQRAMQARDEALARLGPRRLHLVPEEVLRSLGLTGPMIGITRFPKRSVYRVDYRENGKARVKLFYFRHVPEADAYAAAIAFTDELFTDTGGTRTLPGGFVRGRDPRICEVLKQLSSVAEAPKS